MREYTIHPLVVGINETDQGVMTYLRDYGKRIYLPIYVFYLSGGDKHILIDTGLEQFMIPEGAEKTCGFEILEFEDALATLDLKPEDIDMIIHTHLHNDHCENDKNFPSAGPAIAPGVHIDLTEAYDSIQKIKGMADILLPIHDLSIGRQKTIP
jgi:glyoxylase-like metal-dependent hydrolase (beta-lactamase superfamily II)